MGQCCTPQLKHTVCVRKRAVHIQFIHSDVSHQLEKGFPGDLQSHRTSLLWPD